MIGRRVLPFLLLAVFSSAPATGLASGRPLTSGVVRLIEILADAEIVPPFAGPAPLGTLREKATKIEDTPLPTDLANSFVELELRGKTRGRVEQRRSLVFSLPRTFRFQMHIPPEATLTFGYAWLGSQKNSTGSKILVRVTAHGRTCFERSVELPPTQDAPLPWVDLRIELDGVEPGLSEVELRFVPGDTSASKNTPVVAWASPVVTGRVTKPNSPEDRNVLFLVLDAVRGDVVGPGRAFSASVAPHVDALMARGTSFVNTFSAANRTRSSTLAMLQSQPPTIGGFWSMFWALPNWERRRYHRSDPPLLTRELARRGWHVATVGSNHFLFPSSAIGLDHGFHSSLDVRSSKDLSEKLTGHAIDYIRRHKDERWFLFLNYISAHTPYKPPKGYEERVSEQLPEGAPLSISSKYLGELAHIDDNLVRVLQELEALGLDERTLIVVTADHGEVFSPAHACHSELFQMVCRNSHGLTLYDEELHVPLSFTQPGAIPSERQVDTDVSLLDLAPTVLDLLGLPADLRHTGRSLRPAIEGEELETLPIFAEGRAATAIREAGMKLIVHHRRDDAWTPARTGRSGAHPRVQLFDLQSDPGETRNLILEDRSDVDELKTRLEQVRTKLLDRARDEHASQPTATDVGLDAAPAHEDADWSTRGTARNTIMLVPDGSPRELYAELAIDGGGVIECACQGPSCGCEATSETTLRLRLAADGGPAKLSFRTTPWDARLTLRLTVDGDPVPLEHLRVGRTGLALLGTHTTLEEGDGLRLSSTRRPPLVTNTEEEPGVYYWRSVPPPGLTTWGPRYDDDPTAALIAELGSDGDELNLDTALSGDLQGVLANLGYTSVKKADE